MEFGQFLLTSLTVSRFLINSKTQTPGSPYSMQPDFSAYVPNDITLQLSRLNYKGSLCRRSVLSRTYCLQACFRDCVGVGNEVALYKMRCSFPGRKSKSSRSNGKHFCKCYFSQKKKVHKNRVKKCMTSAGTWDDVQDFFLRSYMNRTDCVPSSKTKNTKSSCARIINYMSNVTNIYSSGTRSDLAQTAVTGNSTEKTLVTMTTVGANAKNVTTTSTVEQTTTALRLTTQLPLRTEDQPII